MKRSVTNKMMGAAFLFILVFGQAYAQTPTTGQQQPSPQQPSAEALAKQTQNPVADLISLPLQNNFYFGAGSNNRTVYAGNVEPVIPIQPQRRVESDHAHHHADHQSAVAFSDGPAVPCPAPPVRDSATSTRASFSLRLNRVN